MIIWWGRGERSEYLTPSSWDKVKDKELMYLDAWCQFFFY